MLRSRPRLHPLRPSAVSLLRRLAAICSGLALILPLGGCGGAQVKKLERQVSDLTDEVSELRRGQAAQRVQFDEFRNRLVMLQDKLDSARVQQARAAAAAPPDAPPALPHVVLPPTAAQQAADNGPSRYGRAEAPEPPAQPEGSGGGSAKTVVIGPNGVVRVSPPNDGDTAKSPKSRRSRGVAAGPSDTAAGAPPQTQTPEERAAGLYRAAKAQLDAGQLRAARDEFTAFLRDHPDHPLADNALYWMGETWYAQSLWLRAARIFGQVVEKYPRGNKVPDAMLKTALCYLNLGERKLARDTLTQVLSMYPGTSAARVARVKLDRMRRGS